MNKLDLPEKIRTKRLADMGMTESECRTLLKEQEKEREYDEQFGVPKDEISDKFTS